MRKRILSYLLQGKQNFWAMCPAMGYMPPFVRVLQDMQKEGLLKIVHSEISLTQKGRKTAKELKISSEKMPNFLQSDFKIDKVFLDKFSSLRKTIYPEEAFDQLQLLPQSVIKKITLAKQKDDLKNKKVVCLGDDDMVGIAAALTGQPQEILVLDIDERIVNYENDVFQKLHFPAKALKWNLIKGVPQKFKNKFDVFFTEPPDTIEGCSLFFSRGVELLKKEGGVGYLGVSQNDLALSSIFAIEKNILRMGALITQLWPRFEPYEVTGDEFDWVLGLPKSVDLPRVPWFYSDLFRTLVLKERGRPLWKKTPSKTFQDKLIKTNIYC